MQKYVVGVILLLGCSGSAGSSTTETPDAASEVRADEGRIGSGFGSDIGLTGRDAGEPRLDGSAGEEMGEGPGESADGAMPDPGEPGDAGQDAGQDAGVDAGLEPLCVAFACGFLGCCPKERGPCKVSTNGTCFM
jgi:hypothetical protein